MFCLPGSISDQPKSPAHFKHLFKNYKQVYISGFFSTFWDCVSWKKSEHRKIKQLLNGIFVFRKYSFMCSMFSRFQKSIQYINRKEKCIILKFSGKFNVCPVILLPSSNSSWFIYLPTQAKIFHWQDLPLLSLGFIRLTLRAAAKRCRRQLLQREKDSSVPSKGTFTSLESPK